MRLRYPRYVDSEVESIGVIPSHWGTRRLKTLADYRTSSVDKKSAADETAVRLCNYTDVYYRERIFAGDDSFMTATASAHEIEQFGLRIGDVLITKDSEDWTDIAVPALVQETADDLVCGYHLGIVRPGSRLEPGYLLRALQSKNVNVQLQTAATGVTRYGVTQGAVGRAVIPAPPLEEQAQIGAFLDSETVRIDRLISMQQSLIKRLDEYRTALITRVLTKGLPPEAAVVAGLDPAPHLKDSGVEWLGEVPQHWDIAVLKRIASINDDALSDDEEPTRPLDYVDISSVRHGEGIVQQVAMVFEDAPSRARRLVQDGDTIISTVRTYLRAIAHVVSPPPSMVVSTGFAVVRPQSVEPRFAYWAMSEAGFVSEIVARSVGVSYPAINAPQIGLLALAVPPKVEQRAIAEYLDEQSALVDDLRAKAELSIERLSEYRSAVISAAVTGKIDLRDEAWLVSSVARDGCADV